MGMFGLAGNDICGYWMDELRKVVQYKGLTTVFSPQWGLYIESGPWWINPSQLDSEAHPLDVIRIQAKISTTLLGESSLSCLCSVWENNPFFVPRRIPNRPAELLPVVVSCVSAKMIKLCQWFLWYVRWSVDKRHGYNIFLYFTAR